MNFFGPKVDKDKIISDLRAQVEDLSAGQRAAELVCDEHKNRYVRLLTEFDNFRTRTEKEKSELTRLGNHRLMVQIIPVLDCLDRATDTTSLVDAVAQGYRQLRSMLWNVMSDNGVMEIDAQGLKFDPEFHEALVYEPNADVAEGHVMAVYSKGYRLGNRVLKHSQVVVSSGK